MLLSRFSVRRAVALVCLGALVTLCLALTPDARAQKKIPAPDTSGGEAVAHYAGGKPIQARGIASKAPEADLYQTGYDAVEPSLGITKDGQVFYTAAGTRNEVVTTKDDGKTWKVVSPKLGDRNIHAISLDPYIWVDEDTGRVYTIDLLVACSLMSFSDDRGKSWTTNPLACGRPVNDHQTLFGGPPVSSPTVGYPNVIYYCWNDVATSSCGKSLDGGITWSVTGSPVFHPGDGTEGQNEPRHCGGLHGHGVVGRDGTVYLPRELCEEPWLGISRDEGATWDHVRVSPKTAVWGPDPSVAVDNKGNIYYLWLDEKRMPYISYSRNGGKSWSEPLMLAYPGVTEGVLATLDVGAPGKIAVAYYGTDQVSGPIDKRKYPLSVTWNGYITMTANLFEDDPVFYSGIVNDERYPMAKGECGPRRCQEGYDFIDVVISPKDGTPWAAFADSCVAVCENLTIGNTGIAGRLVGGPSLK
ncbi:MAG: sialidase family protein [Actinomycetota bacterium]